jgi:hypothetical protein
VHHLQLYAAADIVKQLRTVGFSVQTTRSYGSFSLPRAHVAFVAHKPVLLKPGGRSGKPSAGGGEWESFYQKRLITSNLLILQFTKIPRIQDISSWRYVSGT